MRSLLLATTSLFIATAAYADSQGTYRSVTNPSAKPVTPQTAKQTSSSYASNPDYELNTSIESGYRTSELKWNIGGDGVTVPNVLSELQWKKIHGYEFQPSFEYTQKSGSLKGLNIQGSLNKSITTSGENQDSDYAGNDRTFEFSRSDNKSDAGHAEGFSASIGYALDLTDSRKQNLVRFTTLVGYAIQTQTFVQRDGFQTVPAFGPFDGLRSSYDMELRMPFVGMELSSNFLNTQSFKIRGQFSRGTYDGTGHWNLRNDLGHPDSFQHDADGYGILLGAKYGWEFLPRTNLTLGYTYNYFKTDSGTDTIFLPNGTTDSIRFTNAKYTSMDVMAGLNYKF